MSFTSGWSRERYAQVRWWLLVIGDVGIAWIAYRLAFTLRTIVYVPVFQGLLPMGIYEEVPHLILLVIASQFLWLHLGGVYDNTDVRQGIFPSILRATLVHVLFLIAVYYFTRQFGFPRSVFASYFLLDLALLTAWHWTVRRVFQTRGMTRILIVGLSHQAKHFISRIRSGEFRDIELVGLVSGRDVLPENSEQFEESEILGTREDLPRLIREHRIDEIILTPEDAWQDRLIDSLSEESGISARVLVVPSAYETMIGRLDFLNMEDLLTLEISRDPTSPSLRAAKRTLDTVAAISLCFILSPLFLVFAVITKLQDGGPVFFTQIRVGQHRRNFRVIKFRSMKVDAESETGPVLATDDDPRVTPWGRLMRATRIDELPQLINVLRGEMSFVGPRPERPEFVKDFLVELNGYGERFKVKPGLTGLAQVHGGYLSTADNKLKYDLAYIYHHNLWLDVVITLETIQVVLTRRGK